MRFLFACFGFLALLGVNAVAGNFAVVDMKQIEDGAHVMKHLKEKILHAGSQLEKSVSSETERMEKKVADLQRISSTLSAEAAEKKRSELQKEFVSVQGSLQEREKEIGEAKMKSLELVNDKVSQIATDIAKKNGYNSVLTAAFLVYYDSSLDITKDVLSVLNKEMKTVTFSLPNQKNAKK